MNKLEAVTPKLLAQGLMALRSTCVMPKIVNRDYDSIAQLHGSTVNVPIPSAIPVTDVAPGPNAPNTPDIQPSSVPIQLDQWKEAPFYLEDKEMKQIMDGVVPMQASEAVSSLADAVDNYILGQYKDVYSIVGTPGTAPFANGRTTDANNAAMVLNQLKAPKGNRRFVVDPVAEASALELRAFQDVSFNGENFGIKEGEIRRKLGFDWFMDQNVAIHTTSASTDDWTVDGTPAKGAKQMTIADGSSNPAHGDIFTIAGNTQTYTILTFTNKVITFSPGLASAPANNAVLTFRPSHTVNLAFHRDAIAFATRPLEDEGAGLGNIVSSQVDPVSGLSLRLEISREHKRIRFSFDILYGGAIVRPELITRVAG